MGQIRQGNSQNGAKSVCSSSPQKKDRYGDNVFKKHFNKKILQKLSN